MIPDAIETAMMMKKLAGTFDRSISSATNENSKTATKIATKQTVKSTAK